jgi:hypothetical protein
MNRRVHLTRRPVLDASAAVAQVRAPPVLFSQSHELAAKAARR